MRSLAARPRRSRRAAHSGEPQSVPLLMVRTGDWSTNVRRTARWTAEKTALPSRNLTLGFGGMRVYVQLVGGHIDHDDRHRVATFGQQSVISLNDGKTSAASPAQDGH